MVADFSTQLPIELALFPGHCKHHTFISMASWPMVSHVIVVIDPDGGKQKEYRPCIDKSNKHGCTNFTFLSPFHT